MSSTFNRFDFRFQECPARLSNSLTLDFKNQVREAKTFLFKTLQKPSLHSLTINIFTYASILCILAKSQSDTCLNIHTMTQDPLHHHGLVGVVGNVLT